MLKKHFLPFALLTLSQGVFARHPPERQQPDSADFADPYSAQNVTDGWLGLRPIMRSGESTRPCKGPCRRAAGALAFAC